MNSKEKDWQFDFVKGVAMLLIIATHAGGSRMSNIPDALKVLFSLANKSVQAFVVISVILAMRSLDSDRSGKLPVNWVKSHIIKLIPLYVLASVSNLILRGPSYIWIEPDSNITVSNALFHLVGINWLVPKYANAIGFEWYLGVTVFIYIIIPFLRKIIINVRIAILALVIYYPIGCAIQYIIYRLSLYMNYSENLSYTYATYFFFIAHMGDILVGTLLYYLINDMKVKLKKENSLIIIMFGFVVLYYIFKIELKSWMLDFNYIYSAAWGSIIYICFLCKEQISAFKMFSNIGQETYVFYLFNYVAISLWEYINYFFKRIGNEYILWCLKFVFVIAFLYVLAKCYRFICASFKKEAINGN